MHKMRSWSHETSNKSPKKLSNVWEMDYTECQEPRNKLGIVNKAATASNYPVYDCVRVFVESTSGKKSILALLPYFELPLVTGVMIVLVTSLIVP